MGRTDDVVAGPTRRMIPSPEKAYPEYFQNQPFQPARIDEQAVGKNQHVSQLQKVPGQCDMDFESRDDVTVEEYLRMIELKTAVLLAGALKIGALCGGAEPVQAELLYRFGIDLGMAFQLQDDLLDTYGDPAVFGKPVGGDILVGKKTYLLTTALKAADAPTRARLLALLHDAGMAPDEKIAAVRAVYDSLAVRQTAERAVASYFDEARQVLRSLRLSEERLAPLRELSDMLLNRRK